MRDNQLHEPGEKPDMRFKPGKLYSLLDILGGGVATCDLCGRWQRFAAVAPNSAREQLARDGWTYVGDKDVCPKCSAQPIPDDVLPTCPWCHQPPELSNVPGQAVRSVRCSERLCVVYRLGWLSPEVWCSQLKSKTDE